MPRLAYYVSGHGFGHAVRSMEVIRSLTRRMPGIGVQVVTTAPARFFADIPGVAVRRPAGPMEAGMVERDPLTPDPAATLRVLEAVLAQREASVAAEAAALRAWGAEAVASDVSFLAGEAAAAAGVPKARTLAVSNFTWDWIYEPHLSGDPRAGGFLSAIREAYSRFAALLRMPFPGTCDVFPEIIDVPLVTGRPTLSPAETLRRLGISPDDGRPRVLSAARRLPSGDVLRRAAADAPEMLFLAPAPDPADPSAAEPRPANVMTLPEDAGVTFQDLVPVCDAVVSKLGYGIVAECLAAGVALLHPPRTGFREDELTRAFIPRHIRCADLPRADYESGRWADRLRAMLARPKPTEAIRSDGADVCAELIAARL
jgi:L-arabinokinase